MYGKQKRGTHTGTISLQHNKFVSQIWKKSDKSKILLLQSLDVVDRPFNVVYMRLYDTLCWQNETDIICTSTKITKTYRIWMNPAKF